MDYNLIKECIALSDNGQGTFPEIVQRLLKGGIELYYADLLACSKTFYAKNTAYSVAHEIAYKKGVSDSFHIDQLTSAIKQVQAGAIDYQQFLQQIMDAGVICYTVFLKGGKTIYFGRRGEQHVESFIRA